ncbi:hypothetical protein [Streptomyces sp. NPDC088261]|uniref:hypothetical protein n=1 Tax=Streptomyces sp. NPDC088261 TaxID=3365851 RepID=UPI00382D0633
MIARTRRAGPLLAGVSVSYYTRLEQVQSMNASPQVLDAIARALRLEEAGRFHPRLHLHNLARPAHGSGRGGGRRRSG